MGPDLVAVLPLLLDCGLGLRRFAEGLANEQFGAKLAVNRLHVAVVVRTARCDVGGLDSDRYTPFRPAP